MNTHRETANRTAGFVAAGLVTLSAGALYLSTVPPTITWWFGGADSGDLTSAAAVLGIPHPTGYPLFVLLGHLATRVPLPEVDPAGRINLMNVVLAALGAGLLTGSIGTLARPLAVPLWFRWWLAAIAAATVATTELYWSQAIIGEVYALQTTLTALVLWCWARPGTHAGLRGAAHGLALTNHLTSLVLLAAAAAFARPRDRSPAARATMSWFLLGLLAPLVLYALLPLRARHQPAANWGDPRTLERFVTHVTARHYRGNLAWQEPAEVLGDLAGLVRFASGDLPPWVLPSAAIGCLWLWRRSRSYALFTAAIVVGTLLMTAAYRVADRGAYLLPLYLAVGLWAGIGLVVIAAALRQHQAGGAGFTVHRLGMVVGLVLTIGLSSAWAVRTGRQVNLHGDDSPVVFARAVLDSLPERATYYTARDDTTFALWYAQTVLGLRRDVRVVDLRNPALTPP
jgi:hypothetical protein